MTFSPTPANTTVSTPVVWYLLLECGHTGQRKSIMKKTKTPHTSLIFVLHLKGEAFTGPGGLTTTFYEKTSFARIKIKSMQMFAHTETKWVEISYVSNVAKLSKRVCEPLVSATKRGWRSCEHTAGYSVRHFSFEEIYGAPEVLKGEFFFIL